MVGLIEDVVSWWLGGEGCSEGCRRSMKKECCKRKKYFWEDSNIHNSLKRVLVDPHTFCGSSGVARTPWRVYSAYNPLMHYAAIQGYAMFASILYQIDVNSYQCAKSDLRFVL